MKTMESLKRHKILLVDDLPLHLDAAIREKTGRKVLVAKDVRVAARILAEKSQEIEFVLAGVVWSIDDQDIHWITPAGIECCCKKWHLLRGEEASESDAAKGHQGIYILDWVKKNYPDARTILLSSNSSDGERAVDGGAETWLSKDSFYK